MRRTAWTLVALLLVVAGCSGDDDDDDGPGPVDGSIVLTVACTGPACGVSGTMRIPVQEGDCDGPLLLTVSQPGVTTSAGNPFMRTIGLERGFYCLDVYLDVDTDGSLSTGDVISTTPIGVVQAGPGTPLGVTLDGVQ